MAAAVFLSAACQTSNEVHDRLAPFFEELAFGGPFDSDVEQDNRLVKWTEPVRVTVSGAQAEEHRPLVEAQLQRISELTGVPFRMLPSAQSDANYEVEFVSTQDFLLREEYVPCFFHFSESDAVIEHLEIKISVAREEHIEKCIAHEAMHSFGLPYHSGIVRSILSPVHGEEDLTPWDELMLRTLYDHRLRPNMTRLEAAPIARGIVEELLAE